MLNISNENVTRLKTILVNPAEAHRRKKDITEKKRSSCKTCLIKDKNGTLLIENNDVKERWLQYTKELYDHPCKSDSKPFRFEEALLGLLILKEEVWWARKKAKKRKALGPDGIPKEAIKTVELGLDLVHHLLQLIYETGEVPEEMLKSVFITLPKKAGENECENFKTVSLMSHILKLLWNIVVRRIEKKAYLSIKQEQFG